ncbi:MAG: hypothetical protein QE271_07165 [Bacteriovoracaceae bacterium]|nr:hypothetical protein [Bacteriovoracaceae bacterium]
MKKRNKKLYTTTSLLLISNSTLADENAERAQQPSKQDLITTEAAPQKGWKLDHVELKGIFLPTVWVLGFLVVIFIILKYFIYLPDEKRKDLE